MKFIPNQDYRDKIDALDRLIAAVRARKRPLELTALGDAERTRIEDLTRFEQFRGKVLKQNGRRPRSLSG